MSRHINQTSVDLIKAFESLYLESYQCSADVWTVGYGTTSTKAGGHDDGTITPGMKITEDEAEEYLKKDLEYFEKVVLRLVKVEINDDMFGALVSFAFNCGEGNLESSTLLKRVNSGDWDDVPNQFLRWNKAKGKTLNGLTRRRASEARLWEGKKEESYIASVDEMGELGYTVV
jgi:lysozyme